LKKHLPPACIFGPGGAHPRTGVINSMSAGKQDPQGLERGKDDRDQGNFVPSEQRAEGKNENPNVIARAWEAAKESLGLGAWSDKQESQDEKKK